MDYLHTYPNAPLHFFAGIMQLRVNSNDAYLVMAGAKSHIAGHFYLASLLNPLNYKKSPSNAPFHTKYIVLKHIVCSAAEAEYGGLFHNNQTSVNLHYILTALDHIQKQTKIKTDSKTANSFVHASMYIKHSKSWDMQYHWLRGAVTCQALQMFWEKGIYNDANYFMKHHPSAHHKVQCLRYILKGFNLSSICLPTF
eukprot:10991350-Ditylum_brightwellii.AAC.1